jgi:hypothetical protein
MRGERWYSLHGLPGDGGVLREIDSDIGAARLGGDAESY